MAVIQLTLSDVGTDGEVRAELRTLDGENDHLQTSAQIIMESVMEHVSTIAYGAEHRKQRVN